MDNSGTCLASDEHPHHWANGIYDAHCHPTDTMATVPAISTMKTAALTIMATCFDDQSLVADVAERYGSCDGTGKVVPSFGYHPWFSHLIWDDADEELQMLEAQALKERHYAKVLIPQPNPSFVSMLPEPRQLSRVLGDLRKRLQQFPLALVGEVGMDRAFRIRSPPSLAGSGNSHQLSPYRVSLEHQKMVFKAQLGVAGQFGRPVSVHGVQCHGALFDVFRQLWTGHETSVEGKKQRNRRRRRAQEGFGHEFLLEVDEPLPRSDSDDDASSCPSVGPGPIESSYTKPYPPRICLHSFSADRQTLQQWIKQPLPYLQYPSQVYFSFSTTINARPGKGHLEKIKSTVQNIPGDRVLVESDLHTAAEIDDALARAVELVGNIKGWEWETCTRRLAANWREFVFGS